MSEIKSTLARIISRLDPAEENIMSLKTAIDTIQKNIQREKNKQSICEL